MTTYNFKCTVTHTYGQSVEYVRATSSTKALAILVRRLERKSAKEAIGQSVTNIAIVSMGWPSKKES